MAEQVKLVRRCDFATANVSSLDLSSGTAGFKIAEDGWRMQVVPPGANEIEEAITLRASGTSTDNIAANLQALHQKRVECEWSKDPTQPYQIWLADQLTGETGARQAVVKGIDFIPGGSLHDYYPVTNSHQLPTVEVGLTRGHWEGTTHAYISMNLDSLGGTAACSTIYGDIPARLAELTFAPYGTATGTINELWWGFKSNRNITPGSYTSPWDTDAYGDIALGADTDISGGFYTTTFGSVTTMAYRFGFTCANIHNVAYEHLRGQYRILARGKMNAGTARVKMAYGLGASVVYNNPAIISGTSYYLYDIGNVTFPVGGNSPWEWSAMKISACSIYVERIGTTAGTLSIDTKFVAIPIDEGTGHVHGCANGTGAIFCDALGRIQSFDGTIPAGVLDTSGSNAEDCTVPVGAANIIVIAAQRVSSQVTTDQITINLRTFDRWLTLRGNE